MTKTVTTSPASNARTGYSICSICDIGCQLRTTAKDGRVERIQAHDSPALAKNICYKGTAAPHIHNHAERLRVPLKRVGERGEDRWEEISYEQAMDEIAERLRGVIDQHGPESLAVSTSGWNTQVTNGLDRRFMNLLGAPNWISGVSLCAGNTAAVNRLTYGWMPFPDIGNANCIVLLGHNPRKHSWTPIYNMIEGARKNGAKTIVVDPRVSEQAERATMHLQIKAGTDAALLLGWTKVIIDEGLYDKDFVRDHCVGFKELCERVDEYPLDRVAEITGIPAEQIAEAARMYANADGAVIPWTPITDQQLDSTSGIRLQSILRAITGNLDVVGGELLSGPNPDYRTEAEIHLHDTISPEQRAKQLGYDKHPVYTYRTAEILKPHLERVWGEPWVDQVMGCHMANPSEVFRAMADGDPYPVKAFFVLGNNALLSYPNQHQIHRAMLNQDLIVAHEIFMTPTAMLADYVLPGDVFSERNHIADGWAWAARLALSEKVADAPEQAIAGFLKSTGLSREQLTEEDTPKGRFLFARIEKSGAATADLLPGMVTSVLADFPWPKSQRWGATRFRWVRPLHRVNLLLGGAPLAGELDLGGASLAFTANCPRRFCEQSDVGSFNPRRRPYCRLADRISCEVLDAVDRGVSKRRDELRRLGLEQRVERSLPSHSRCSSLSHCALTTR